MHGRWKVIALVTAVTVGLASASVLAVTDGAARDESAAQTCKGPFDGKSPKDIQTATHNAALVAVKTTHGACGGKVLRVDRIDLCSGTRT